MKHWQSFIICLIFGAIAYISVHSQTRDSAVIYCEHMDYYIIKTAPSTLRIQCVAPELINE